MPIPRYSWAPNWYPSKRCWIRSMRAYPPRIRPLLTRRTTTSPPARRLSRDDYTIACICPMGVELAPVEAMLDEIDESLPSSRDQNSYTLGRIGVHNIVIAVMPEIGNNRAATVATQLLNEFKSIRFGLLVGVGGGIPSEGKDIRLGDVVVSKPTATFAGVVQYDMGKATADGLFVRTGTLRKPPAVLVANVERLRAQHIRSGSLIPIHLSEMLKKFPNMEEEQYIHQGTNFDRLFEATHHHQSGSTCEGCDAGKVVGRISRRSLAPRIHYGTIASGNSVIKDGAIRERLRKDLDVVCVEMEAAGLMDEFSCLVIRGICDYADSHKNKHWQPYAAATAAAYMKELLCMIPAREIMGTAIAVEALQKTRFELGLNIADAPDITQNLFIGRELELQKMEEILLPRLGVPEQKMLILGGLGGIGKTQLALAYAKRHRKSYDSIFWLNAKSEATLKRSFRSLAMRVHVPGINNSSFNDEQIRAQVSTWLSEPNNSRWLLIFDNYDRSEQYNIKKYYPYVSQGSIIITTRSPESLSGSIIYVQKLRNIKDSLRILATRSGREGVEHDAHAQELARRLDGLPLALATTGAFLKQSAICFAEYLRNYQGKWNILQCVAKELPEYRDRTLYTAWDLSFKQIKRQDPDAARLLKLLAYFDNQDVWYELLAAGADQGRPSWFVNLTGDRLVYDSAMRTLVDFCLVEVHASTESYSLHACVHDWTLDTLNRPVDPSEYGLAFDCVLRSIDSDDPYCLSSVDYRRLTAHAIRLDHDRFRDLLRKDGWTCQRYSDIRTVALLLQMQNKFQPAERMYKRALAGYEKALGPDHTLTLDVVNDLGNLCSDQGKTVEAEQMYQRALTGYEKALGSDHTLTLNTVANLGALYIDQGKMVEAEQMCRRALAGYEKAVGPDHISTLHTFNNLGGLYLDQGRLVEAEQLYQQALAGCEKAIGPDHISTLNTVNNLGSLYYDQGKIVEAEQMYQRALAGFEKALGASHTSTLNTTDRLGGLYSDQGKMVEAEQMYQRALAGFEKALGPDHTSTLNTVNNIGILYRDQGKMVKAEQMYQRALAGREKALGPDHKWTLDTVNNLGILYSDRGKIVEAEQMYQRALRGYEKALGVDHKSTLNAVNNLGLLYYNQGKMGEAEQMYQQALAGYEKAVGSDHISTLMTVNNLGNLYRDQDKMVKAEQMYQRALTGREKALGPDHKLTLSTVNSLGAVYCDQGKMVQAEQMYQRALLGNERVVGPDHISTLYSVQRLGNIYRAQGKIVEAEQMYQRAWAGFEKALGVDHTSTLVTVHNLGVLYLYQGKMAEAEQMYRRALAGYEKTVGPNHTSTLMTVNNLGALYGDQGKTVEAEQMYHRALAGFEKVLGSDHTLTLNTVANLGALYIDQGKMVEAEQMCRRALASYEKDLRRRRR